jgi:SAM-dependent methyltransferase
MSSLSSPTEFQLTSVAFFGRTLEEYLRFFGLAPEALAGRRVLDVAAGPSSFTAEARAQGARAVAVDPLYGLSSDALGAYVQLDYDRVLAEMRRKESLLRYGYFSSFEAAESSRRLAARRFLEDYEDGFLQGRYVSGVLPRLPFADASFDLVLCAHLLFTYARHFDYAWHLSACRELARVSAGEVRLHPLCGPDGKAYPELDRLARDLGDGGIRLRAISVDYEFFAGSGETLILSRAG